ncbi:hypothetical protein [Escherichia coli]|uniref:hypothetical protein n=1 Tax=Escherichia coli TaxID=562 RepID=UPI001C6FD433|nr:hypothetical protein [Escherichia coli]MBW9584818.1 hypothetical protein [Escherichia coli]
MDCRKANIALITIVSALLIISCLVLVKFLFSDTKGFAWGSVSDWFTAICSLLSAVGTLGTLYVAYLAYNKVPEWMAQKHYDIAYGIIEKSIFQDLPAIRSSSLHLHIRFLTILRSLKIAINNGTLVNELTIQAIDETDAMVINFHQDCYAIINQLKSINRTNYSLTYVSQEVVVILQNSPKIYSNIYSELYLLIEKFKTEYTGDDAQIKEYAGNINLLMNKAIDTNDGLKTFINKTYHENRPIADFIMSKKN